MSYEKVDIAYVIYTNIRDAYAQRVGIKWDDENFVVEVTRRGSKRDVKTTAAENLKSNDKFVKQFRSAGCVILAGRMGSKNDNSSIPVMMVIVNPDMKTFQEKTSFKNYIEAIQYKLGDSGVLSFVVSKEVETFKTSLKDNFSSNYRINIYTFEVFRVDPMTHVSRPAELKKYSKEEAEEQLRLINGAKNQLQTMSPTDALCIWNNLLPGDIIAVSYISRTSGTEVTMYLIGGSASAALYKR